MFNQSKDIMENEYEKNHKEITIYAKIENKIMAIAEKMNDILDIFDYDTRIDIENKKFSGFIKLKKEYANNPNELLELLKSIKK